MFESRVLNTVIRSMEKLFFNYNELLADLSLLSPINFNLKVSYLSKSILHINIFKKINRLRNAMTNKHLEYLMLMAIEHNILIGLKKYMIIN